MNIQKVNIVNKSSFLNIKLLLTSPEDATTPSENNSIELIASEEKNISYQNATANLFIWNENGEMIWRGIIPTKVQHPIEIYPEDSKVVFDGMILPDNFKTITNLNQGTKKTYHNIWLYFLIFALIVIIIIGYLLKTGKVVL